MQWHDYTIASISNGASLTVIIDGEYFTISRENPNFETARQALSDKDVETLIAAIKPIKRVEAMISKYGQVRVENDCVYYGDEVVHGVLVDRILEFARKGFDFDPLAMFLDNLMQNPSKTAVDELYLFLESSETPMPITEDGHFLAYKKVRHDFKDIYSGTVDYSIGAKPSMPRNSVNDNRNQTCSSGLHFCSLSYLRSFGSYSAVSSYGSYPSAGDVVIIVKINPRDVVSIPSDYSNAKGRACLMEVIGLHKQDQYTPAWTDGYAETSDYAETYSDVDTVLEDPDIKLYNARDGYISVSMFNEMNTTLVNLENVTVFSSRQSAREFRDRVGGKVIDLDYAPGITFYGYDLSELEYARWLVVT